jgi:two-component system response regulator FixJ
MKGLTLTHSPSANLGGSLNGDAQLPAFSLPATQQQNMRGAAKMIDSPVFLIDDDPEFRQSAASFFTARGIRAECFGSAASFLNALQPGRAGCIILDMKMPDMSGFDLQENLIVRGFRIPIIFLTAYADVPTIVRAMKYGAYDFLLKPVDMKLLFEQAVVALEMCEHQRNYDRQKEALRARLRTLTEREHDILSLALSGKSNKEISQVLGISHRTVETHRSHILVKIGVNNLLELAHIFIEIENYAPSYGARARRQIAG